MATTMLSSAGALVPKCVIRFVSAVLYASHSAAGIAAASAVDTGTVVNPTTKDGFAAKSPAIICNTPGCVPSPFKIAYDCSHVIFSISNAILFPAKTAFSLSSAAI